MPFKVTLPNGLVVEVDNPQDVIALDRAQAARNGKSASASADAVRKPVALSEKAKRVLKALKKVPDGLLNDELAAQSGVDSGSLPPVFRGLRNWTTALGIEMDNFLARERVAQKDKLVTKFKLTDIGLSEVEKLKL